MKKCIAILLLLCLLLTGCEADISMQHTQRSRQSKETAPTETTVLTEPETTLPPHSEFYLEGYSVEDVIAYFNEVCLDTEWAGDGDATVVQKWMSTIYYYVYGAPTQEDLMLLEDFTGELNELIGFPTLQQTQHWGDANLNIYFGDSEQMEYLFGDNAANNDGAVQFWYDGDNHIYNANICVRTDLDQHTRNSVIMEELYNGLGPVQDTSLRQDSLIYSAYSTPQEMTDMDRLILKLLYHPDIKCGMNAQECEEVIRQLYY